jgi:hypothetical protein
MFTIIYSIDIQKPIDAWTAESFKTQEEAMINACELLESGYYVNFESTKE